MWAVWPILALVALFGLLTATMPDVVKLALLVAALVLLGLA
jgi:hypothetical protein